MVPLERIELSASPLPRVRSTTELQRRPVGWLTRRPRKTRVYTPCLAPWKGPKWPDLVGLQPVAALADGAWVGLWVDPSVAHTTESKLPRMPEKESKTAPEAPQSPGTQRPDRQDRLSKALRDNLKRRKAQSRKRTQSTDE